MPKAHAPEHLDGGILGLPVAQDAAPVGQVGDRLRRIGQRNPEACIFEGKIGLELATLPGIGRTANLEQRLRGRADFLELQFLGKLERGKLRRAEQLLQQRITIGHRHLDMF